MSPPSLSKWYRIPIRDSRIHRDKVDGCESFVWENRDGLSSGYARIEAGMEGPRPVAAAVVGKSCASYDRGRIG